MSIEELEAKVKKLSMRSTDAKMKLHDLSEELPTDWERIPEIAEETFKIFRDLAEARKALKDAKKTAA